MNDHTHHNVTGHYCWTCQRPDENGIPYWPKGHNGEYTHYSSWTSNEYGGYTESVVWANGDVMRPKDQTQCGICDKHCRYPVDRQVTEKGDKYREIRCTMLK